MAQTTIQAARRLNITPVACASSRSERRRDHGASDGLFFWFKPSLQRGFNTGDHPRLVVEWEVGGFGQISLWGISFFFFFFARLLHHLLTYYTFSVQLIEGRNIYKITRILGGGFFSVDFEHFTPYIYVYTCRLQGLSYPTIRIQIQIQPLYIAYHTLP